MIDVLVRLTDAIQSTLSPDRYLNAQRTELPNEEFFREADSNLIDSLSPTLRPYLKDRLLAASIQRRRILQYTDGYHERFIDDLRRRQVESTGEEYTFGLDIDTFRHMDKDRDWLISLAHWRASASDLQDQNKVAGDDVSYIGTGSSYARDPKYKFPAFPKAPEYDTEDLRTCVACWLALPIPNKEEWK